MSKKGIIYKITNPNGKIYIGQTTKLLKRKGAYKRLDSCIQNQIILYRSLKKYGWNAHSFEIIESCDFGKLNERERYWQEFYNCSSQNGLNCLLTNTTEKNRKFSEETRNKQRKAKLGTKHTEETKKLMSSQRKGSLNPNYNKQFTKKHKKN